MKFLYLLILTSCATAVEMMDPTDQAQGYEPTKNEKGETVYKRTRDKTINPTPIILSAAAENSTRTEPVTQSDPVVSSMTDQQSETDTEGGAFPYLEVSGGDGHLHLGGGIFFAPNDVAAFKVGASMFTGVNDIFLGFDAGGRLLIPMGDVKPFVGAGGYIGDHKTCEEDGFEETCEKKYLTAGYFEFGVSIKSFSLFSRTYTISEADVELPLKSLWGINLGF